MPFNTKEATKLIKERAGFYYSRGACAVLLRMLGATFRATPVSDITVLKLRTRITTLMKWASVSSTRQADRIIVELSKSGIVHVLRRRAGEIEYRLDVVPLVSLVPSADTLKERITQRNHNRAEKAREVRAANRRKEAAGTATRYVRERADDFFSLILGKHIVQEAVSL